MAAQTSWQASDAAGWLRAPGPQSHKYSRGVLGVRTGSPAYPGAALLGVSAAWRTGVGMVQYFPERRTSSAARAATGPVGVPTPAAAILAQHPETVIAAATAREVSRTTAWLIGSGTQPQTRSKAETARLGELLLGETPVVVDAGALDLVAGAIPLAPVIVTPHLGEFWQLWQLAGLPAHTPAIECAPSEAALTLAAHLGVTVLLKGSTTIAATPEGTCLQYGPGTPWLATAGTGDVLAGVLAALVATTAGEGDLDHERLAQLGVTAALLHDRAARIAAHDPAGAVRAAHAPSVAGSTGRPITASDVVSRLPEAFQQLRELAPH